MVCLRRISVLFLFLVWALQAGCPAVSPVGSPSGATGGSEVIAPRTEDADLGAGATGTTPFSLQKQVGEQLASNTDVNRPLADIERYRDCDLFNEARLSYRIGDHWVPLGPDDTLKTPVFGSIDLGLLLEVVWKGGEEWKVASRPSNNIRMIYKPVQGGASYQDVETRKPKDEGAASAYYDNIPSAEAEVSFYHFRYCPPSSELAYEQLVSVSSDDPAMGTGNEKLFRYLGTLHLVPTMPNIRVDPWFRR